MYAEEGTTYLLPCIPASLDAQGMIEKEYQWVTGDGELINDERYLVLEDGSLEIDGVIPGDSGMLICELAYGDVINGEAEVEAFKYVLKGKGP